MTGAAPPPLPGLDSALAALAREGRTTTYGTLARDLGLTGPGTIARLTGALEDLMQADAAAGRPFRAALVDARGRSLPAPGFFAAAHSLGHDIADPGTFVARQRDLLFAGAKDPA